MRRYLLDIIPRIKSQSKKLDDTSILTNKSWVIVNDGHDKVVYIFRRNQNQLIISKNGIITKGNWDYIDESSIMIDRDDGSFLFRHGFIDDTVLALQLDGTNEYALLVEENQYNMLLSTYAETIQYLESKYLQSIYNASIESEIPENESVSTNIDENKSVEENYEAVNFEEQKEYEELLDEIDRKIEEIEKDNVSSKMIDDDILKYIIVIIAVTLIFLFGIYTTI